MRKAYYGSLCYAGIRGGAINVDDNFVIYKSQVLTLPEEYKNIMMPIKDIEKIEKGHVLFFPTVRICLKNEKSYKFVIFNRKSFLGNLKQLKEKSA